MNWDEIESAFPPHDISMTLAHNEHRCLYQSIGQYTEDRIDRFVSEDEYAKAIATNELWELQWYPDTPVGFHVLMASTLGALMAGVDAAWLTQHGDIARTGVESS